MITIDYHDLPTGISEVEANDATVTYFDMFGKSSATPFKGMNIKVEKRADGSVTNTKIFN